MCSILGALLYGLLFGVNSYPFVYIVAFKIQNNIGSLCDLASTVGYRLCISPKFGRHIVDPIGRHHHSSVVFTDFLQRVTHLY